MTMMMGAGLPVTDTGHDNKTVGLSGKSRHRDFPRVTALRAKIIADNELKKAHGMQWAKDTRPPLSGWCGRRRGSGRVGTGEWWGGVWSRLLENSDCGDGEHHHTT